MKKKGNKYNNNKRSAIVGEGGEEKDTCSLSHKIDHYNNDTNQQKVISNNDMNMDMDIDHSVAAATTTTTTRTATVLLHLLLLSIIVDLLTIWV